MGIKSLKIVGLVNKLVTGRLVYFFNTNKKFRSFDSKENIHKKEAGPYHGFSY